MKSEVRKAMILAAGEGTRLRPLTSETPKVLVPINGKPLLEYTLLWLKGYGISEVAINLCHLGNKIRDFLGDGSKFGVNVHYSVEEAPLGTAGGVKKVGYLFTDIFVVVYGDILTNLDLKSMIQFHREKRATVTLAVAEFPNPWEVGIVEMNEAGKILNFIEKPARGAKSGNRANGGVYVLQPEILDYIPDGHSDFACDIFPKLLEMGVPLYGYLLCQEDYLIDIGTVDKYNRANQDVKAGKLRRG